MDIKKRQETLEAEIERHKLLICKAENDLAEANEEARIIIFDYLISTSNRLIGLEKALEVVAIKGLIS